MTPLFSIIIPVYNVEKYVQTCIDSVISQTYSNLEIIMVDDGSTDTSGQLCDKAAMLDPRIKVIHQKNAGLSAARNAGIDKATGDYLYFVDSDDYIDKNLVETVLNAYSKYDVDIVIFGTNVINEDSTPKGTIDNLQGEFTQQKEALGALLQGEIDDYAWNKVCKRHIFEQVYYPVGHNWEDAATTYKLFLKTNKIVSIPDRLYYYRSRKDSISAQMTEKALQEIYLMNKSKSEGISAVYPELMALGVPSLAKVALALFDRSLWAKIDDAVLSSAQNYLEEHKAWLRDHSEDRWIQLYYRNINIYRILRIMRHKAGMVLRSVRKYVK